MTTCRRQTKSCRGDVPPGPHHASWCEQWAETGRGMEIASGTEGERLAAACGEAFTIRRPLRAHPGEAKRVEDIARDIAQEDEVVVSRDGVRLNFGTPENADRVLNRGGGMGGAVMEAGRRRLIRMDLEEEDDTPNPDYPWRRVGVGEYEWCGEEPLPEPPYCDPIVVEGGGAHSWVENGKRVRFGDLDGNPVDITQEARVRVFTPGGVCEATLHPPPATHIAGDRILPGMFLAQGGDGRMRPAGRTDLAGFGVMDPRMPPPPLTVDTLEVGHWVHGPAILHAALVHGAPRSASAQVAVAGAADVHVRFVGASLALARTWLEAHVRDGTATLHREKPEEPLTVDTLEVGHWVCVGEWCERVMAIRGDQVFFPNSVGDRAHLREVVALGETTLHRTKPEGA